MRITGLAIVSPAHFPASDRRAIEALLRLPADADGRRSLELHGIGIEAHACAFFLSTAAVLEADRAPEVSATLWSLLERAEQLSCAWVLVDRDEPADSTLARYP